MRNGTEIKTRAGGDSLSWISCWMKRSVRGKILAPEELVRAAGGINERLRAKQKYELLLRIAQQSPIVLEEIPC